MLLLLHIVYTAIKITYEVFRICFSSSIFSASDAVKEGRRRVRRLHAHLLAESRSRTESLRCLSGTPAGLDGTVQACGARVQQLRVRPGAEHGRMRPPPTSTPTASMRRRSNGAQPTYRTHIAPQLLVSCIKQPLRTMSDGGVRWVR
jgi:hypothetical protein